MSSISGPIRSPSDVTAHVEGPSGRALPIVGITAERGLIEAAKLAAGQEVFVNGCMGGVGLAAVQVALGRGARVSGSCRGDQFAAGARARPRSGGRLQDI